jgi:hypothetical protein
MPETIPAAHPAEQILDDLDAAQRVRAQRLADEAKAADEARIARQQAEVQQLYDEATQMIQAHAEALAGFQSCWVALKGWFEDLHERQEAIDAHRVAVGRLNGALGKDALPLMPFVGYHPIDLRVKANSLLTRR